MLNKIWKPIIKIWKDPVWSKVISAGIILLIASLWTRFSNYSGQQVYDFFILLLTYKLPIFVYLSIIGLYFLVRISIRVLEKKNDPIGKELVGNFKFQELYEILSAQNYPVRNVKMTWSGKKPPEDDLLSMFYACSAYFNKGLSIDDDIDDGGYLYGVLSPKLLGYGLLEKLETKNKHGIISVKYQTSEVGHKFYSLLEKKTHLGRKKNTNA